ncbi:hypothetical protein ACFU76_34075 [Streptomyces sp. NPDC057539]|uniref:hypothetical protein n=1 Tax=Streptomyces sp. NPDC057539 TaxID=3346159 RepID=UPI0036C3B73E
MPRPDAAPSGPQRPLNFWQATGKTMGTLEEWRERKRGAFRKIDEFHEAARVDLGVQGKVTGENHPERDPLLPTARRDGAASA